MNPKDDADVRAEKLFWQSIPAEEWVKTIAAEIRAAVEEAKSECDHESPCCDSCIDKFRKQGRAEAYLDAAKIADEMEGTPPGSVSRAIRAKANGI